MTDRQRDMFLWVWSRRRRPGRAAIVMRGLVIGAVGGVAFAAVMLGSMGGGGNHSTVAFLSSLKQVGMLFGLSIPAFAALGFLTASRVFSSNEAMYQSLLRSGARVPDEKPILRTSDRGPAIAVGIVVAVIVAFIVIVFIKFG